MRVIMAEDITEPTSRVSWECADRAASIIFLVSQSPTAAVLLRAARRTASAFPDRAARAAA